MELYSSLESLPNSIKESSLTIGTFDGMHQGHIFLIKKMIKKSKNSSGTSVLITFSPNPCTVINNISVSKYHLSSKEENIA